MSSRHPDDEPLAGAWVDAWQAQGADSRQIQRAYLRFLSQRRPLGLRATALQISRWILVGAALGVGTVYAATGPLRLWGRSDAAVVTRVAPTLTATPSYPAPPRLGPVEASSASSVPQPPLPAPLNNGLPGAPTPTASASEAWQRAARGLRERDFETANAALEELARHGGSAERESAQLVQAQLLLAQGRESDAANLLRTLRASAQSASVRQKSTELLARMNETRPSQRSFAPPAGTNDP